MIPTVKGLNTKFNATGDPEVDRVRLYVQFENLRDQTGVSMKGRGSDFKRRKRTSC